MAGPWQARRIEFIVAFVRGETVEDLAEWIELVVTTSKEFGAFVHDIAGGMIVMAFGTVNGEIPVEARQRMVKRLQQLFAGSIKIVHGAVDGYVGFFGGKWRATWTFTFPHFDHALAILGQLPFGKTEEYTAEAPGLVAEPKMMEKL